MCHCLHIAVCVTLSVAPQPCNLCPGSRFNPSPAHANVLSLAEGLADINLAVGGRDHLHLGHLQEAACQSPQSEHSIGQHAAARLLVLAGYAMRLTKPEGGYSCELCCICWVCYVWTCGMTLDYHKQLTAHTNNPPTLRSMISMGRSNSCTMHRGMAPPQGCNRTQ